MFLPFADYPNPQATPWVTRILIALNVAIFLFISMPLSGRGLTREELNDPESAAAIRQMARLYGQGDFDRMPAVRQMAFLQQLSAYDVYTYVHGFKPGAPDLWDLLYCMFLHGGWLHLLGNMLYLWIYGDNVEARMGPLGYLAGYLVTGAAATWTFALLNRTSMVPLVGASGAISGVLGFYLIWFPHNRVKVFVWMYYFMNVLHIRAVWLLLFYVLLLQNFLPVLAGAQDGVAYWAHIGGFGAGAVGAVLINLLFGRRPAPKPTVERWQPLRKVEAEPRHFPPREDLRESFSRAVADQRWEDADYAFQRLLRLGGQAPDPDQAFALGRWLYENDFSREAEQLFRYYVRNYPRGHDLDRAHLALGILLIHRLGQKTAARQHLLTAIDLASDPAIADRARKELEAIGG